MIDLDAADFARLTRPFSEPCLLVTRDGIIVGVNLAAVQTLSADAAELVGASLAAASADPAEQLQDYLRRCAASGQFIPGSLRLARAAGETVRFRCEGALVRPQQGENTALLLLRLRPHPQAADRFIALNQKMDALAREIQERRRAEEELQAQAVQLEENAVELELMIDELESQKEDAQRARSVAEGAMERIAALQRVTAALSQAVTASQVVRVVLQETGAAVGARAGLLALLSEDGESFDIAQELGLPGEALEHWRRLLPGEDTPLSLALPDATPRVFASQEEGFSADAGLASADRRLRGELVLVPLPGSSGQLGAVALELPEARELAPADRDLIAAIARQGALALERARLFEAERDTRALVTAAARRVGVLAEAGALLASSLDPQVMLEELVSLCVTATADLAAAYLLQADDSLLTVASAYSEALDERAVAELEQLFPLQPERGPGPGAVARSAASVLIPEVEPAGTALPRFRSVAIVPLQARGRTLGAMTLATTENGAPPLTQEDLALVEELARRAAIAVDTATLLRDAQQANRAKADFLAVMSHELRTPLNAIVGYVDLLDAEVEGPISAGQRRQLTRIKGGAWHLVTIIEDILEFARLEAGKERVNPERVDLTELAREAADLIEPAVAQQGLGFTIRIPDSPVWLETDPPKARQILLNLLSNAAKFTESGEIGLALAVQGEEVACRVWDTGVGIAPGDLQHIFEPFWQVQRGTTRGSGGTGLGLTVTRRLAQLLGGDLSVASEPGTGSTFTFRLPRPASLDAVETRAAV